MKKITLLLFMIICTQLSAQNIVIGTGTVSTAGTGSDPVDGYFEAFRYQTVYTAAELTASLTPGDIITGLGFSVDEDYHGGNLLGYTIKLAHTSVTNAATHNATPTTVVKNAFNYDPSVTAAGVFDMITFDNNFVWNGTDNILVEICSDGPNPYLAAGPHGGVRATSLTNGSRRFRTDGAPACGDITGSLSANRPNIRFNYTDGAPPACVAPNLGVSSVTSGTTVTLSWNSNGPTNAEVVIQAPGAGIPAIADNTGTNVTGSTYNAISLTAATAYEYYVRNECTIGSVFSTWSGPYLFNTTQIPGCPTLNTPANNFVANVSSSISFSWTPAGTGDPATSYDLFSGTSAGNVTNLVGNYTTTTTDLVLDTYATTIYWKVVAKNVGGSSTGCAERIVSTGPVPGTYCLNAPNGQWPSGAAFSTTTCDGTTSNEITASGYGGEYSLMNTEAGRGYTFTSSVATDLITISVDGINAVANGTASVSWTAPATGTVRFYTHGNATACAAPATDRIRAVICSATLSTTGFTEVGFTAYPNPVKDILNLSYTQDISKVSVHNLLGQEVITKSVNATQSQIDMSNLSNGTYLVKVTSGGATKTLKVLKQ